MPEIHDLLEIEYPAPDKKRPLVVIAGPTASGKSAFAVDLCRELSGSVISADSMQVYRYMKIGTAVISKEEQKGIPHYLLEIIDPDEEWNVYLFRDRAKKAYDEILSGQRLPFLCGGTGFYVDAFVKDTQFRESPDREDPDRIPVVPGALSDADKEALFDELKRVDPDSAEAIHPNNVKRVQRALQYFRETGEKISEHNRREKERPSPYACAYFVLTMPRALLYERINTRVDGMIRAGLAEEVRGLREKGYPDDLVSMQGLGYRQMLPYLDGRCTLAEAAEQIKTETRHFAKRQLTWFKRNPDAVFIERFNGISDEELFRRMLEIIRNKTGMEIK